MNRRKFLKTIGVVCAGVITVPAMLVAAKEKVTGNFWMQTYGPWYNPIDIEAFWDSVNSRLTGIYSGETIEGLKASKCSIGDVLVLNDGKRYCCTKLGEGFYKKGRGIYLK